MVSIKSRAQEKALQIAKRESENEKRGKLRMILTQRYAMVSIRSLFLSYSMLILVMSFSNLLR